jgi:nucleotide-binding universal stress UspA family protein
MTSAISHILVPTDGSALALKAATKAGDLARAVGARVTVLIVHDDNMIQQQSWGPGAAMSVEQVRAAIEDGARRKELADALTALGRQQTAPRALQVWGHPAEQVVQCALDDKVDLIVMGSHGRSGFKRVLLGSVSNTVVNHAGCPVLIVR